MFFLITKISHSPRQLLAENISKSTKMSFIYILIVSLICFSSLITAQQPYARKTTTNCGNTDNSTSVLGYTCNGLNPSCQAYLIFRSLPPYNTVSSISALLAATPSQVSQINSVSETAIFDTNKEVIVPVNCSCSGQYYQANTSHVIVHEDTYFLIANDTFQGLSTCQALKNQNSNLTQNLYSGETISVPLRCACPTKNQIDGGVNYLLSYLITWKDSVSSVSTRFGGTTSLTLEANGLSEQDTNIYPFTTLLIPLQNPPSDSDTLVPPPPPSPPSSDSNPPSSNKSSKNTWVFVVIGVLAGTVLLLFIGIIVFCVFFRKSKMKAVPNIESESFTSCNKPLNKEFEESQEFLDSISSIAQSIKVYRYEELQTATDDFSPTCRIEGSVYRGRFNADFAAIKKMNGDVSKEITLLNKINHFNLIRLSGICFNDGHWYLVYEYASNGPLNNWIHTNNADKKFLNWTQRVQIALDVATGLNYLHSYTVPPHVHKDVKSSNILLDSDFRAKIANFGLARSAEGKDGQFTLTRHIVGTKGYMAPEYLENGLVSTKLDIYAFGVLMLEIITGKEAAALNRKNIPLSDIQTMNPEEDGMEKLRNLIDPSLQENYPLELAVLMVRLIDNCLKKDPAGRPTMDEIVQNLTRMLDNSLNWELSNSISSYQSFSQSS